VFGTGDSGNNAAFSSCSVNISANLTLLEVTQQSISEIEISVFNRGANEIFALLGCYAPHGTLGP
jgi:hypothetical protein